MYWHIGSKRKASATVAMTVGGANRRIRFSIVLAHNIVCIALPAVATANSICIESKKKNITSSDMEAPSGKQSACIVSNVAKLSATHASGTNARQETDIFQNTGHTTSANQKF